MTGPRGGAGSYAPRLSARGEQHEMQEGVASALMGDMVYAANAIKGQKTLLAIAPKPGEALAVALVLPVDCRKALSIPSITCFGVMDETGGQIYHSEKSRNDIEQAMSRGLSLQEVVERFDAKQYTGREGVDSVAGALIRIAKSRAGDVPGSRTALERCLVGLSETKGSNARILSAAC
ncbi:hypothetical protein KJ596_03130 [Patescibacteria group bacterium]|nr:hypothetical protein [Patescibacteria group bacterium]MBU1868433.1 hypothetical protein [Patescibacteria group bacterium]